MRRILPACLLPCLSLLAAPKELEGVRAPAAGPCPTVEEAIAKMKVPEGFEVRNFAAEPMVINPVAMAFDDRGRLWVVELYEYPSGAKQAPDYSKLAADTEFRPVPKPPDTPVEGRARDRVKVLEDTDNDGKADKATVFVDGLNLATGILLGHGGVYIGQAPNLLFFRDTNGDDVADEWKTVLTGFGLEDRHELLNGFTWGPDGWLYFTHGVFTHSKVRRPGEPPEAGVKLDAGVGRVKPLTGEFEVFADGTSNPWGVDFDERGNAFVSACVIDHLFHLAPGGLYHRQGGTPEYPYGYDLLPSIVKHKHFRAAYAGVQVYKGWAYPEDLRGRAFIGNIHDNAVHEEQLTATGSAFLAETTRDFLRAENGWFRPVSTQLGPDDQLWIMDWCDKYPCYQNAQANPEGVDRERGRIWRVVYTGSRPGAPVGSRLSANLDLGKAATTELVFALQKKSQWEAQTARRILAQREDATISPMLANIVQYMKDSPSRLPALWTLISRGAPPSPVLLQALAADTDPAVRLWTARWIGEQRLAGSLDLLETLAADADTAVRLAVASSCRRLAGGALTRNTAGAEAPDTLPALDALCRASGEADATLALLAWTALQPHLANPARRDAALSMIASLPASANPLAETLAHKAVRMLCDRREAAMVDAVFRWIEGLSDAGRLSRALEALVKAQEAGVLKPSFDTAARFEAWRKSEHARMRDESRKLATLWGDPGAVRELLAVLNDEAAAPAERLRALQTARKLQAPAVREAIARLLGAATDEALLVEAVRGAGALGGADLGDLLFRGWTRFPPAARVAAADALTTREDWAGRLLDALGSTGDAPTGARVRVEELPMSVRRYFGATAPEALRKRARETLGAWRDSDEDTRKRIAAKRKAALEGTPDLARGRQLFEATCATCHPFLGSGQAVGPDLTGSGRSNLDALLANLIDPNQIIGRGYENMLVKTRDGRALGGRIVEDTPGQVRLLNLGGKEEVIARDQVVSIEDTGQSLMPAGFGELADDVIRDLVWYVLAPPEEGALTAEKREALIRGDEAAARPAPPAKPPERKTDRESASLWNPAWRVDADDFEGTPTVLPDYHGRKNVLLLHPKTKDAPAALERVVKLPDGRDSTLVATVTGDDRGDWDLRVLADGKELHRQAIGHDGDRWRTVRVPLNGLQGREVRLRLEAVATGWAWEFSYWDEVRVE